MTESNEQPEKLDLRSHTITDDKKHKLLQLFPEIRTEGGKIDFEWLKLALGETVDVGRERYGMNWPGKADCFKTIQQPSMGTLLPCKEESVDFDTTENMIIEGDNLEVLKLLQKSYLGKVKMIEIDPPYNTGSDFIYPDNYTESLQTYLEYSGQVDNEGRKFSTNSDTDGRFHSKWMNMMYPRLYLARNLLREDGVIFIHIDDGEVDNLHKLCKEVFGEANFIGNIVWQKKYSPQNDEKYFSDSHEHIALYARNLESFCVGLLPRTEEANERYKNPDNDERGPWKPSDLTRQEYRPRDDYEIISPKTGKRFPPPKGNSWGRPKEVILDLIKDKRIWFGPDGNSVPQLKRFLSEVKQGITPQTLWLRQDVGDTQEGKKEIKEIFGDVSLFETPKPTRLIGKEIITSNCSKDSNSIILDFFAGSGTTANAVLDSNRQDNGNRKFILVQLPEPTGRNDYKTIADITKERVRRAINKIKNEQTAQQPNAFDANKPKLDLGFKVFKLSESNFKTWNPAVAPGDTAALEHQLEMHIDHLRPGRTQDDILYEVLLKSGFPLSTKIETLTLAGKTVFSIAEGGMFICLERNLTQELIKAIADKKPMRVVCLDEGFSGNDQLKTNAVQTMKAKGVVSFRTV